MTLVAVNLGLPKSGTTTLAKALRVSGLKVADHKVRGRNFPELKGQHVAELLYRGYFDTGDPGALLKPVSALSEISMLRGARSIWPQMDFALIEAIRAHHPGVKFLASRRNASDLSRSMLKWSNLGTERLPNANVPGLPQGFGVTGAERERWIDGHYCTLERYFRNDPDFLMFDVADENAPKMIAAHLNRDLPWWGKLNANPVMETS